MKQKDLENTFAPYRKPTPTTTLKYEAIQNCVAGLAELINDLCPESREKSIALTDLQSTRMWANAAIAIHTPSEA